LLQARVCEFVQLRYCKICNPGASFQPKSRNKTSAASLLRENVLLWACGKAVYAKYHTTSDCWLADLQKHTFRYLEKKEKEEKRKTKKKIMIVNMKTGKKGNRENTFRYAAP
jgi:hypothetical protein